LVATMNEFQFLLAFLNTKVLSSKVVIVLLFVVGDFHEC
jgi:hypothetical protein